MCSFLVSPGSGLGLTVGNSREEQTLSPGERGPSWNVYSVTFEPS